MHAQPAPSKTTSGVVSGLEQLPCRSRPTEKKLTQLQQGQHGELATQIERHVVPGQSAPPGRLGGRAQALLRPSQSAGGRNGIEMASADLGSAPCAVSVSASLVCGEGRVVR